jgi:hypothetical protein
VQLGWPTIRQGTQTAPTCEGAFTSQEFIDKIEKSAERPS